MAKRLIDVSNLRRPQLAPQNRAPQNRTRDGRLELRNDTTAPVPVLYIYDDIDWYGITSAAVAQALSAVAPDQALQVRINSRGGDVWEGVGIYNLLASRSANVDVYVDGIAASIASVIAMSGDKITVATNALMMVHRAWGCCIGDVNDMRTYADVMEKIENDQIVPTYVGRTKKSSADIMAIMQDETWMNAGECVSAGFADCVGDDSGTKAKVPAGYFNHAPAQIVASSEDWTCGAATGLPIDKADAWDGEAAKERMFEAAGFNGSSPDAEKCRGGFLAYDKSAPTEKDSYKLPFADIVDGKLTTMEGGLGAAASRLPDTDIPDDVKSKARQVLDDYYARRDKEKQASVLQRMKLRARSLAAAASC